MASHSAKFEKPFLILRKGKTIFARISSNILVVGSGSANSGNCERYLLCKRTQGREAALFTFHLLRTSLWVILSINRIF